MDVDQKDDEQKDDEQNEMAFGYFDTDIAGNYVWNSLNLYLNLVSMGRRNSFDGFMDEPVEDWVIVDQEHKPAIHRAKALYNLLIGGCLRDNGLPTAVNHVIDKFVGFEIQDYEEVEEEMSGYGGPQEGIYWTASDQDDDDDD